MNDNFNVPYNSEGEDYIKASIPRLLRELKCYLENNGKRDFETKNIISNAIEKTPIVTKLPEGEFKEELYLILYYDLMDAVSTAQGLNLSDDRVKNYISKVESINKALDLKGKDIDLTNVKELLKEIEDRLKECLDLTHMISPKTWLIVENFISILVNDILRNEQEFKDYMINTYTKDNMMYNMIINDLDNTINENKQGQK